MRKSSALSLLSIMAFSLGLIVLPAQGSGASTTDRLLEADSRFSSRAANLYEVIATVPVGDHPWAVTPSMDGSRIYVSSGSTNFLSIVDASTLARSSVNIGSVSGFAALSPQDDTAYVSAYATNRVVAVRTSDDTVAGSFRPISNPWALAINGDDSLFAFEYMTGIVRRYDLGTGVEDDSVTVAARAESASITRDGRRIFSTSSDTPVVTAIDTAGMTVAGTIPMPALARLTAVSPDQGSVYVTAGEPAVAPRLLRLDADTLTLDDTWTIGSASDTANGVALSPDGRYAYVALAASSGPGSLLVVDAATGQVLDSIAVGANPSGVAVSPSGDRVYVGNFADATLSVISVTAAPPAAPPAPEPATPPRDVQTVAGDASAAVSWAAPQSAGSYPVSHYQATSEPGGRTCLVAAPALTCEVIGLTNGTSYTFTVRALTGAGWSAASDPSIAVTPSASSRLSIVITGSREGQRVMVSGTTTGFGMGGVLRPWLRFPGQSAHSEGAATILVSMDGTFEWGRRTGKRVSIYVQTPDGTARSNVVTIQAR